MNISNEKIEQNGLSVAQETMAVFTDVVFNELRSNFKPSLILQIQIKALNTVS